MLTETMHETEIESAAVNNNQELIEGLRKLADFLEARPDFQLIHGDVDMVTGTYSKEDFLKVRAMMGAGVKISTGSTLDFKKSFSSKVSLLLFTSHSYICERVSRGFEKVPVTKLRSLSPDEQAAYASMHETTIIEREIVEWKCPDSILALATEGNSNANH